MSGIMVIDHKNVNDPCRDYLLNFLKCSKGKSKEERTSECYEFGSNYLDCRTNPKKFKIKIQNKN